KPGAAAARGDCYRNPHVHPHRLGLKRLHRSMRRRQKRECRFPGRCFNGKTLMTNSLAIGTVILLVLVLATVSWYLRSYRKAHAMSPVTMLRARSRARSRSIFQPLSVGDTVSHAGTDYVVEDISSSFADGETSRM